MKVSPRSLTHCLALFNYFYTGVTVARHRPLFLVGWIATVCRLLDPPILAHSGSLVLSLGAPNLCFFRLGRLTLRGHRLRCGYRDVVTKMVRSALRCLFWKTVCGYQSRRTGQFAFCQMACMFNSTAFSSRS